MAGPSVPPMGAYNNYAMLHAIREVLIAVNSKNYKQRPAEDFDKVFKQQYRIMSCKDPEDNKLSLAAQSAVGLIDANTPQWIIDAVQEELDGSTSTDIQDSRPETTRTESRRTG